MLHQDRREFLKTMAVMGAAMMGGVYAAESNGRAVVLLEAERFEDYGGWLLDQQFMDIMGSPMLLAHGLGEPVKDAVATVEFPETGTYQVYVRTRDWVGSWKRPDTHPSKRAEGSPGVFQLLVNGTPLATSFGNEGETWHWQKGDMVQIVEKKTKIALHDLTGFEGRCDAIVFSKDPAFVPPEDMDELDRFRRHLAGLSLEPEDAGSYDLVVNGGGIAGICAAVSAARRGLKVALIQDRPVLGGNNSSEIRVSRGGSPGDNRFPGLGKVLEGLGKAKGGERYNGESFYDQEKLKLVTSEANISLFLNHRANAVETRDSRIVSVTAQDVKTGIRRRFIGRLFADCTGDADVGFLAKADFDITMKKHMGPTNYWNPVDTGKPAPFPRCPWALDLRDLKGGWGDGFPERISKSLETQLHWLGWWNWESGFDHDPIRDAEYIRDWNFRAMYGAWDCLKNTDKQFQTYKLGWAAHIAGKRESRRLLGDVILDVSDHVDNKDYPDACVPTTWGLDIHIPVPGNEKRFPGDAFRSMRDHSMPKFKAPYFVPYRCLYSRNIQNLFMAGRNISTTHLGMGSTRVMNTCGLMGEVVGMAAALCQKHDCAPRDVYQTHLSELLDICKGKKA